MRRIKKYSTPRLKMIKMNYGQTQLISNDNSIFFQGNAFEVIREERWSAGRVLCVFTALD